MLKTETPSLPPSSKSSKGGFDAVFQTVSASRGSEKEASSTSRKSGSKSADPPEKKKDQKPVHAAGVNDSASVPNHSNVDAKDDTRSASLLPVKDVGPFASSQENESGSSCEAVNASASSTGEAAGVLPNTLLQMLKLSPEQGEASASTVEQSQLPIADASMQQVNSSETGSEVLQKLSAGEDTRAAGPESHTATNGMAKHEAAGRQASATAAQTRKQTFAETQLSGAALAQFEQMSATEDPASSLQTPVVDALPVDFSAINNAMAAGVNTPATEKHEIVAKPLTREAVGTPVNAPGVPDTNAMHGRTAAVKATDCDSNAQGFSKEQKEDEPSSSSGERLSAAQVSVSSNTQDTASHTFGSHTEIHAHTAPSVSAGSQNATGHDSQPGAKSSLQERVSAADAGAQQPSMDAIGTHSINTAKLIQHMSQTEMRVGMNSSEFGNVAIKTSVVSGGMAAQISVERGDLGKILSTHLPELQSKLSNEHGISARIEVVNGGTSNSGSFGENARQQEQQQPQYASRTFRPFDLEGSAQETAATTSTRPLAYSSGRLDVRA